LQDHPDHWSGIGFVFSPDDPYFGIDLDDCLDAEGNLKPWAQPILGRFADSYAEISPSGLGIKIFAKGTLPGGGVAFALGDGRVEVCDHARYFTVTGNHWAGRMLDIEEHQAGLDWLLTLSPHGQRKVPFTVPAKIPKGTQHDTLVSLAGTMRARGFEYPEIEAALLEMNRSRLERPAPDENIRRIADSICRFAPGDKRGIGCAERDLKDEVTAVDLVGKPEIDDDTLPDFPEIAWRGVFADYRDALAGTTEASDVAHLTTLWAGAEVTLGRRVFMSGGDRIFPNAYPAVFGPTGDKKTTAQRRLLNCGLLHPSVRVIRNQGSTEGLADALKRDDGADAVALFFWEELTALLARGRWTGSTILEFITEAFDCPPEWGMKYRKDPISVVAPTPTILAGTTSEWFWKNARADDFFGGFGNRFLFLTGPKKGPIPNPAAPGGAALQRVHEALARLSEMHQIEARFNVAAERLWERFYTDWEQRERTGLYAATVKRVHVYIRKLAMTYAALEQTLPEINIEQLKAAIAVGVYAGECARALVDAKSSNPRPEIDLEQKFLKWIREHEGARKGQMQQTMSKVTGGVKSSTESSRTCFAPIRSRFAKTGFMLRGNTVTVNRLIFQIVGCYRVTRGN
jgi:hypothetical protein